MFSSSSGFPLLSALGLISRLHVCSFLFVSSYRRFSSWIVVSEVSAFVQQVERPGRLSSCFCTYFAQKPRLPMLSIKMHGKNGKRIM